MPKNDAIIISDTIAKNKQAWIQIMMTEELGLGEPDGNPLMNGVVTFISFVLFGLVSCKCFFN